MLMPLCWTFEIIGDLLSTLSTFSIAFWQAFLKLKFDAVVVFSQKELRLPRFGKLCLRINGKEFPFILHVLNFILVPYPHQFGFVLLTLMGDKNEEKFGCTVNGVLANSCIY